MNIELLAYTPEPESVCNLGAKACVSVDIPRLDWVLRALDHALESGHESVLEHASFTFTIEGISRACSHQLVRHRMASYSQQSQRYVRMDKFDYVVPESIRDMEGLWHKEKEGTLTTSEVYVELMDYISELYVRMIRVGIPEEDARYILPNACTTNLVVTMNARELRHFFSLRCCERAQWEIKQVADMMLDLVKEVAPTIFEDAGPRCKQMGYCPEKRGCGRVPKRKEE